MTTPISSDITEPNLFLPQAELAHTPGQVFEFADGRAYVVQSNGAWKKTKEEVKGKARRRAERTL